MKKTCEWKQYLIDAVEILLVFVVYGTLIFAVVLGLIDLSEMARNALQFRCDDMPPASVESDAGVGRVEMISVPVYTSSEYESEIGTEFRVWCENESPLPDWWNPEEATIVWVDSEAATDVSVESARVGDMVEMVEEESPSNVVPVAPVKDIASPDWNLNTSLVGWDGHLMEVWEMDLFARCFYLEFWGTSELCCQAGCDAMLNLWTSGLYGKTMSESLWAVNDFGKYVYSVYPYVWTTNYDVEGLAWCREFCENRFQTGPSFQVMYFQLYGFHDSKWATPCFVTDGVYFSMAK